MINVSLISTSFGNAVMKRTFKTLLTLWLITIAALSHAVQESITYIHTDHLGSPILATAQDGSVKWREDYQPYGTQLTKSDGDNLAGFTGHLDEKLADGCGTEPDAGRRTHPFLRHDRAKPCSTWAKRI